jgi:hypothetical protein
MYGEVREEEDEEEGEEAKLDGTIHAENVSEILIQRPNLIVFMEQYLTRIRNTLKCLACCSNQEPGSDSFIQLYQ